MRVWPLRVIARAIAWLIGLPGAVIAQQSEHLSSTRWDGGVGGLSAIAVAPDGRSLISLSDRGWIVEANIQRDATGRITAIHGAAQRPLRGADGKALGKPDYDAEGIDVLPDGTLAVSYESPHRIWRHARDGRFLSAYDIPEAFKRLGKNRGIEALARVPGGGLVAMPEYMSAPTPIWVQSGSEWGQIATLDGPFGFAAVGADVGPDGDLYVLQRAILGVGFSARVVRIDLSDGQAEQVLRTTSGVHGNLEGVSVWRDAGGHIRLTMVADNNRNPFQVSEVVEYKIVDDGG